MCTCCLSECRVCVCLCVCVCIVRVLCACVSLVDSVPCCAYLRSPQHFVLCGVCLCVPVSCAVDTVVLCCVLVSVCLCLFKVFVCVSFDVSYVIDLLVFLSFIYWFSIRLVCCIICYCLCWFPPLLFGFCVVCC